MPAKLQRSSNGKWYKFLVNVSVQNTATGHQPNQNYDISLFLKKMHCKISILISTAFLQLEDHEFMLIKFKEQQAKHISDSSTSSLENLELLNKYFIQQK